MENKERFWVVWCPTASAPRHRHCTKALATNEAKRLAAEAPGREFIVLEAIGRAVVAPPPVEWTELVEAEIPF